MAKADLNNREKAMNRCVEELETDMELLGVTGVEGNFGYIAYQSYR